MGQKYLICRLQILFTTYYLCKYVSVNKGTLRGAQPSIQRKRRARGVAGEPF